MKRDPYKVIEDAIASIREAVDSIQENAARDLGARVNEALGLPAVASRSVKRAATKAKTPRIERGVGRDTVFKIVAGASGGGGITGAEIVQEAQRVNSDLTESTIRGALRSLGQKDEVIQVDGRWFLPPKSVPVPPAAPQPNSAQDLHRDAPPVGLATPQSTA